MKTEEFNFYDTTCLKSYNLDKAIRYQLNLLDTLDVFTRRHSENVASITCRLCKYLHCKKDFTLYCTTSAYLHDIGKLFVPADILQKPGKLTDEEYKIMKKHTVNGYNLCMKDLKLRPYATVALNHHEALNGMGYPSGVKDIDIPFEAKIIRVADEFEALTVKNKYKTHVGIVDVLNLIIENTKPINLEISESLEILANDTKVGKIDRKIVRALFKVVVDDIEYEISQKTDYMNYLKQELSRLEKIKSLYKKIKN